ncbi:acireductone synthase [Acidocella sp.]|uniref:acireductone synthase n=1 Tax=Acidocella sp. TaxID=50710 RepID=UPI0026210294|nr:acireductone synthase [Acidocella sp.]
MIRSIITDIEGTTTPISFVHRVLFPYARERLPDFLQFSPEHPALINVPKPRLETLIKWMDQDEKETALKSIQGEIWKGGFANGHLKGEVYADVPPALQSWSHGGINLYIYSSGSVDAQRLLFSHTAYGDLTGMFKAFFDTNVGSKKESNSYLKILAAIGGQASDTLFLSDAAAELDAASAAGLSTCQLVRPEDKTVPCNRHQLAHDFSDVSNLYGLPRE